jgi:phosphatidylglycerol:prolipoprotein diacylglycerol transferase
MIIQSPGPIAFYIGDFPIRWYGLLFCFGMLLSIGLALYLSRRWGIVGKFSTKIYSILFAIIVGYISGRLYHVACNWDYFSNHPSEILQIWQGGLAIHGAILGTVLAGAIACYINKFPFPVCCDIAAIVVPLFQAIVRWGNFFNSEGYGLPASVNFPFKLYLSPEHRLAAFQNIDYYHPTFLYESIWDFGIFILMFCFLSERIRKYPGLGFLIYIILYSIGRFFIEYLRIETALLVASHPNKMPFTSVISLILIVFSIPSIFILVKKQNKYLEKAQSK